MSTPELQSVTLSVGDRADIHKLFAEGYGDLYKPRTVDHYLDRATKIPALADNLGNLAAAALLENSRIASGATTTNRALGNRIALGHQMMALSRNEGGEWMSIGDRHRVVQIGARIVGMERVNDDSIVSELLEQNNMRDEYEITRDSEKGLFIVAKSQGDAPYQQQIWAWPEVYTRDVPSPAA